jgi:hypothetical membrane protein
MTSSRTASQAPRAGADCTPAERVTRSLLGYGVIAGPFYILASVIQGVVSPGFDFARHDWSLLSLGTFGWIHSTVLVLTGLMVIAAAVGIGRELRSQSERSTAAWFLGGFGVGMIGAGLFPADPAQGFPPGSPAGQTADISWHGLLHLATGGLGFISLVIACLLIAARFRRLHQTRWFVFSLVTGLFYLAAFVGIASGGATSSVVVLAFTAAVLLAFLWLLLLCRSLYSLIGSR